jgi:ankyrin repeat protein
LVPSEIHDAIRAGDLEHVEWLVAADPSVARERDEHGISALLLARYSFRPDLVTALLAGVGELDVFEAAALGRPERVRELVDADPSLVNAYAPDGFYPLGLAAFFGHAEVVPILLERGAAVTQWAENPIRVQPLHAAVAGGDAGIARLLLDAGAPVNSPQENGFTPLHGAAFNGNLELAELLLERGADLSAQTVEGKTPADLAREKGHTAVAELLERST